MLNYGCDFFDFEIVDCNTGVVLMIVITRVVLMIAV